MKALVLSAGYGERLKPLTDTTPKPLLEAGGRPLIHYPLLMLRRAGILDVAVNIHHLGENIKAALGDGGQLGLRIAYSPEPKLAGTGGPLLALRGFFGADSFVLLNCDTLLDLDLTAMIEFHRARPALATFLLRGSAEGDPYSRIECDGEMRIRRMRLLKGRAAGEFNDFPAGLSETIALALRPYMYCGVMVCEPEVLTMTPAAPPFSLMGEVFAPALAHGATLRGFFHDGYFRTVDDLASYRELCGELAVAPPPLQYLD
jgi:NDP-sugar pyrophosphorylase family protein